MATKMIPAMKSLDEGSSAGPLLLPSPLPLPLPLPPAAAPDGSNKLC